MKRSQFARVHSPRANFVVFGAGAAHAKYSMFKPRIIIHRKLSIVALLLDSVFRYHLCMLLTSKMSLSSRRTSTTTMNGNDVADNHVHKYLFIWLFFFFSPATHTFKVNGRNIHSVLYMDFWLCEKLMSVYEFFAFFCADSAGCAKRPNTYFGYKMDC